MMVGASLRNLPLQMFEELSPGQIVDYCISYNNTVNSSDEVESEREATQNDFDNF